MSQDSFGIIWLATQDGLNRYNGQDFEYTKKYFDDITRPNQSRLGKVYIDNYNHRWLITENGQLERWNEEDLNYNKIEGVLNASCILQSGHNYLVGSFGNGVYLLDARGQVIQHNLIDQSTHIYNIVKAKNQILLCTNKGLFTINDDDLTIVESYTSHLRVSNVAMSSSHYYIATYGQGLWQVDHNFKGIRQELPELNIEDLHIDRNQNIWIATYGDGLWHRPSTGAWEQIINDPTNLTSINYNDLLDIMEDDQGNIWIGSDGGGVSIYSQPYNSFKSITNYNTPNGISVDVPRAIAVDVDQNIWVGTSGKGLTLYNSVDHTFTSYNDYLPDLRIMCLHEDTDCMWVGTQENGLLKVDKYSKNVETIETIHNKPIWDILPLHDRELLLCSNLPELLIYNTVSTKTRRIPFPSNISFPRVAYAHQGNIYIGCNKGELISWNTETDTIEIVLLGTNKTNGSIKSINYIGEHLWIGTQKNGLLVIDHKETVITHMTNETGLPNNTIYAIVKGKKTDEVWLATNNGLVEIQYRSFETSDSINSISIVSEYTIESGLPSNEFNTGAYYSSREGNIYLGALSGVVWFDPEEISKQEETDQVAIERFNYQTKDRENMYKNVLDLIDVHMPHGVRGFQVHFAKPGISMSEPEFDYRMSPYHTDWITNGTSATFSNIPAGDYELELRLTNNHEVTDRIHISISQYWYEWLWVKVLAVLLIIGSMFSLFKVYRARLILRGQLDKQRALSEKNKEILIAQNTFFANVTHEFRTPLTVISGLINQLSISSDKKEIVKRNSNNLLELVNQMMDFSKIESGVAILNKEKVDLIGFLKILVSSYDSLADQKNIRLCFKQKDMSPALVYAIVDRKKLKSAIGNIIANAIQYGQANDEVQITCEIEKDTCIIAIKDTGRGIPPEYIDKLFDRYVKVNEDATMGTGLGLAIAKKYIELMDGSITLQSVEHKGSTFSVNLPYLTTSMSIPIQENISANNSIDPNRSLILIVEDNYDMQDYLKTLLSPYYEVIHASNGIEGKKMALRFIPDLIISDAMMPEMDGVTMIQHLKKLVQTSHIPIIMLTAKTTPEDRQEGLASGAIAYVAKPFAEEELMNIMESMFRDRDRVIAYFEKHKQLPYDRKAEDDFVSNVRRIIRKNLSDENFGVQAIAEHLHLDRSQIYRKLKSLTGLTPKQLIRNERIHKAKMYLDTGELTISKVAYKCGYSDPSYFSKVFKEQTGQTPTEYSS